MNILETIKNLFLTHYKYTNSVYPSYMMNIIKYRYTRCKLTLDDFDDDLYTFVEKRYIESIIKKINMPIVEYRKNASDCDDYVDRFLGRIKDFTCNNKDIENGVAIGKCWVKNTITDKTHKCLFFIDVDGSFYFIDTENKNIHQMVAYIPYKMQF